jgi:hypothetical protein
MYARCYVSARFSFSISGYYFRTGENITGAEIVAGYCLLQLVQRFSQCSETVLSQLSASVPSNGWNQCPPMVGISALQWLE